MIPVCWQAEGITSTKLQINLKFQYSITKAFGLRRVEFRI
jgi:hypothetical protein